MHIVLSVRAKCPSSSAMKSDHDFLNYTFEMGSLAAAGTEVIVGCGLAELKPLVRRSQSSRRLHASCGSTLRGASRTLFILSMLSGRWLCFLRSSYTVQLPQQLVMQHRYDAGCRRIAHNL